MARVSLLLSPFLALGCDDFSQPLPVLCAPSVVTVAVNEPLTALDGESAASRFDRVAAPWDCVVRWIDLPETVGVSLPSAGESALDFGLERTSDIAQYREYARTPDEKYEGRGCPTPSVFVPCALGLQSDDGGLDETLDATFEFRGENSLLHLDVDAYEFAGTHTVEFAGGAARDFLEVNLALTPGGEPSRVDGSIVESAAQSGRAPDRYFTTAVIECLRPGE